MVQALLAIKPGEITGIIQLEQAYTIVRLNEHIMPGKTKFADVKDSLQSQLQKEELEQTRVALDKRLRANAKVEERQDVSGATGVLARPPPTNQRCHP